MKGIGIAKDCLSLFQVKGILIDLVEHFALFDIGKLDLRMPVPQKGTGLIAGKPLVAYQEWEGAVSVFFSSFPAGSVMICMVLPPSFCARILKCISAFHSGIYFIRKGRKCKGIFRDHHKIIRFLHKIVMDRKDGTVIIKVHEALLFTGNIPRIAKRVAENR